jgi:hypothetical protein
MRLVRRPRLQRSGCICLAITALFTTIPLFLVAGTKYAKYNQNPVLSPFLEYVLASSTTTSNISITNQCSPCECSIPRTLITSVDKVAPQEDDWKFTFGRGDRDLVLDDQDCDAAFPGLYDEINRATQSRGYRQIMLQKLTTIETSNGMVRAMIHDRHVISPPQVAEVIDVYLVIVICPCSKFSRPRTPQERRCYFICTISGNYGNATRLFYTQYRMGIHHRRLPTESKNRSGLFREELKMRPSGYARFRILERFIRRPWSIRRNYLPGNQRPRRSLLGL